MVTGAGPLSRTGFTSRNRCPPRATTLGVPRVLYGVDQGREEQTRRAHGQTVGRGLDVDCHQLAVESQVEEFLAVGSPAGLSTRGRDLPARARVWIG